MRPCAWFFRVHAPTCACSMLRARRHRVVEVPDSPLVYDASDRALLRLKLVDGLIGHLSLSNVFTRKFT